MDYIESQTDYCRRLLSILRIEELRYITFSGTDVKFSSSADIHLSASKGEFIEFIIDALEAKAIDLSYAAMKMCRRPHIWFTMLTGNIAQLPIQANLQQFFSTNDEGWFGPLNDPDTQSSLYIFRRNVFDYLPPLRPDSTDNFEENGDRIKSDTLVYVQRPWCVILEIFQRYAVLSWNGFDYRSDDADGPKAQFPFWIHINNVLNEMQQWLSGIKLIDPYSLVLNTLWDKYRNNPDYVWEDVGARSEQDGVAMSARSGGRSSKSDLPFSSKTLRGIATLANRLAYAALDRLDPQLATDDNVRVAMEGVLEQVIKHGAIKSFEFALRKTMSQELIFQSHIYFGARQKGQDSLVHFRTYQKHGEASQSAQFLAQELGVL